MYMDHGVAGRRARDAFFFRRLGSAAEHAAVPVGMLDDEAVDSVLPVLRQRVVGGAHVDELGFRALRRDRVRGEQRVCRAHVIEAHVRVPQPVGALVGEAPVVVGVDFADLVEVALVDDLRIGHARVRSRDLLRAALHGPQQAAERDVLLVRGRAVMPDHADGVFRHCVHDLAQRGVIDRPADVDAVKARGVERVQLFDFDGHAGLLRFSDGLKWRSSCSRDRR